MYRLSALALFATSATFAAPVPKGDKKELYFPLTVGDTMVTSSGTKGAIAAFTQTVTKVEGKAGKYVVTVDVNLGGQTSQTVEYEVSPSGVLVLSRGGAKVDPPAPMLKLSAKPGETWETESPKGTATMGKEEEVEVPAGKYKAMKVDVEYDLGMGRTQKTTLWFAPGLGIIKQVTKGLGGRENTYALKEFTPGKGEKDEPKKDK